MYSLILSFQTEMKHISEKNINNIISLLNENLSLRQIAPKVGVSIATVSRVRKELGYHHLTNRGGRPAKLSQQDRRRAVRLVTSGKADNAVQVAQELNMNRNDRISAQTVRRALKNMGMKSIVKKKKTFLSAKHKSERLDFARQHQYWIIEDWKRFIWSDETKINRLGPDGRKWAWKTANEPLQERFVQGTIKYNGGNIMMWGCMTYQGVGFACRIDGGMDAELYTNILNDELQQTVEYFGIEVNNIIFQHDNDPKHTSRRAQKWLEEHHITTLKWPAQSPDLNPIEHLWDYLKRKLAEYNEPPQGMIELWERVEAEWEKIPQDICTKLIDTMPKRIKAVIKAKGGYTKY